MMAESQEDKDVDSAISRMQALLDELKAAQRKDVQDESGEEADEYKGRNLQDAQQEAFTRVRAHNRRKRETTIKAPGA